MVINHVCHVLSIVLYRILYRGCVHCGSIKTRYTQSPVYNTVQALKFSDQFSRVVQPFDCGFKGYTDRRYTPLHSRYTPLFSY